MLNVCGPIRAVTEITDTRTASTIWIDDAARSHTLIYGELGGRIGRLLELEAARDRNRQKTYAISLIVVNSYNALWLGEDANLSLMVPCIAQ